MKKATTPEFNRPVVDLRVAEARRRAIKFLEELGIECPPTGALSAVLDLVRRYDPNAVAHLRPELEEAMGRHAHLLALLVELKTKKLL